MTSKERMLSVLRGKPADRIAWAPFLTYWWDQNLVADAESLGEIGFKRAIGADILMRGHRNRPTNLEYTNLEMYLTEYGTTKYTEKEEGNRKYQVYETPIGSLQASYIYSPVGDTWFLQGHPVKTVDDFKILSYIANDMRLTASNTAYEEECAKYPDTLFVPLVTPFTKTAFQSMLEYWVGTEELCYLVNDEPEVVQEALRAMQKVSLEAAKISAASSAEVFISWEDTSTTNISPTWYEEYILPEINQWCDILHSTGKLYIQHACGYIRSLLPLIASSKIDAIESVGGPPTSDISAEELGELLPERITVIGGIEPTFLIHSTEEELKKRVETLCEQLKGRPFIMANADSCPPEVDVNKFGLVTEYLYRYYGLEPPPITSFDKSKLIAPRGISSYHGSIGE